MSPAASDPKAICVPSTELACIEAAPFVAIAISPEITTGLKLVPSAIKAAPLVFVPMVMSSPDTVKSPDTSTLPFISIVVALISISVSETKSKTPSADWCMYVPESPNCNCLELFNSSAVSATWVKLTSESAPKFNTAASESKLKSSPTATSPDISNSVATILSLNVAAPAADISNVKAVIPDPPSSPLNKISLSWTFASKITSLDELCIRNISVPSSS